MTLMLLKYLIVIAIILASVPLLQDQLYLRSLDYIRALKPYHTPFLTKLMNFVSAVGDGEPYVMIMAAFLIFGGEYVFTYMTCAFFMNQHWINFLKTAIGHSRPQFDDPTLGVVNESEQCSGEFGNPSGHSLMASCVIVVALDCA